MSLGTRGALGKIAAPVVSLRRIRGSLRVVPVLYKAFCA